MIVDVEFSIVLGILWRFLVIRGWSWDLNFGSSDFWVLLSIKV